MLVGVARCVPLAEDSPSTDSATSNPPADSAADVAAEATTPGSDATPERDTGSVQDSSPADSGIPSPPLDSAADAVAEGATSELDAGPEAGLDSSTEAPSSVDAGSSSSGFMVLAGTTHQCIAVAGGEVVAGASLETRTCDGSSVQGFTAYGGGPIRASGTNLCIDATIQGANGGPPSLQTCNGETSQAWTFADGVLTSVASSDCLDVLYDSPSDQTPLDMSTCNQTRAQLFWPFGIGLSIRTALSLDDDGSSTPLCLADQYDSLYDHAALDLEPCSVTDAQFFTGTVDNELTLHGMCIDVVNADPAMHGLQLFSSNGAPGQRWTFAQVMGGSAFVSGLLDETLSTCITADTADGGSSVDLEDCNEGTAQTWRVTLQP
jgi:hypothetical protein